MLQSSIVLLFPSSNELASFPHFSSLHWLVFARYHPLLVVQFFMARSETSHPDKEKDTNVAGEFF